MTRIALTLMAAGVLLCVAARAELPAALEALRAAPPAHPAHFELLVAPRGLAALPEGLAALGADFALSGGTAPGGLRAVPLLADDAPPALAFTHGNTRILRYAPGRAEPGARDALLDWLRADLEEATAANLLLLVDQPYFAEDWAGTWAPVANLLAGHPVRWVVALDAPNAPTRDFGVFDGVRYIALGGDGGQVLHLRVRGDAVAGALLAPGAVAALESVPDDRLQAMARLREAFHTSVVEGALDAPLDAAFVVTLHNPGAETLAGELAWHEPPGWRVEPPVARFEAAPGTETRLSFRAVVSSPDSARHPAPAFSASLPGPAGPVPVRVPLAFQPTLTAARAVQPVVLDGALDDWVAVTPHRLTYAQGYSVFDMDDLVAWLRVQWTPEALLVGVETRDDEVAHAPHPRDGDHVRIQLGESRWILGQTPGGPRALRQDAGAARALDDPGVALSIRTEGPRSVYELALPHDGAVDTGHRVSLRVEAHDADPGQPRRPPHHASLTPEDPAAANGVIVILGE